MLACFDATASVRKGLMCLRRPFFFLHLPLSASIFLRCMWLSAFGCQWLERQPPHVGRGCTRSSEHTVASSWERHVSIARNGCWRAVSLKVVVQFGTSGIAQHGQK